MSKPSLGEQFGVDPFEHFSNVNFTSMSEWRPGGHHGEIDEGIGQIELSNPLAGSNVSIPVVGRHLALGPSGPFQFGEGPPFRSQGAEGVHVHHEWDFQALTEMGHPSEDETFDFEKLYEDPWHPRRRTNQGIETNMKPVLRYGVEWDTYRLRSQGQRITNEPLIAQRLTRGGAMREVTHLADNETEQSLGWRQEDETLDPEFISDRGQIDRRIDRFEQAGVTSGQTIIHGGIHSLIEQHDRWLQDIENYTAEERLRTGEGLPLKREDL
jgi:hypothetical protein